MFLQKQASSERGQSVQTGHDGPPNTYLRKIRKAENVPGACSNVGSCRTSSLHSQKVQLHARAKIA